MIVDLTVRTTTDKEAYKKYLKSSDSLIFVDDKKIRDVQSCCLDFTVGSKWFNLANSKWFSFPEEGIVVKPYESLTIETSERLALPYNVFGIVTGVGRNIYIGGMISAGKIDPGFDGRLSISFFNSGKKKKRLKSGDMICACYFIQMEGTIPSTLSAYKEDIEATIYTKSFLSKSKDFFVKYWDKIISILIAGSAAVIAFLKLTH